MNAYGCMFSSFYWWLDDVLAVLISHDYFAVVLIYSKVCL